MNYYQSYAQNVVERIKWMIKVNYLKQCMKYNKFSVHDIRVKITASIVNVRLGRWEDWLGCYYNSSTEKWWGINWSSGNKMEVAQASNPDLRNEQREKQRRREESQMCKNLSCGWVEMVRKPNQGGVHAWGVMVCVPELGHNLSNSCLWYDIVRTYVYSSAKPCG